MASSEIGKEIAPDPNALGDDHHHVDRLPAVAKDAQATARQKVANLTKNTFSPAILAQVANSLNWRAVKGDSKNA
jgi:hypothetical protein